MLSLYRPMARILPTSEDAAVSVKCLGQQACLKSICAQHSDKSQAGFDGLASVHFELSPPGEPHRVRVEIDGRTIGFLSDADGQRLAVKAQEEGLGLHPLMVNVRVRAGSLRDEGPPFFYFAELLLDLDYNQPWRLETLPENENDQPSNWDPPSHLPDDSILPSLIHPSPIPQSRRTSPIAGEVFGRGIGFLFCLVIFVVIYTFLLAWRGNN